jgi:hypothetical protein
MHQKPQAIEEIHDAGAEGLFEQVGPLDRPVVFRGVARHWPLVEQARKSAAAAAEYLKRFDSGQPVTAYIGESETAGRIFYNEDVTATNFRQSALALDRVLEQLLEQADNPAPPTIYVGSSAIDLCLPGLGEENSLPRGPYRASVRIWIGNRTVVAAHYDAMENIACVCAGQRRFTLFPPEQLDNLYVGPMELTPAGQQISMVDLNHPDLERFPRFAEALEHARSAVLEPGDAIYIPSMWWHHVEGLDPFNILINHWWREVPDHMGAPNDALLHAILNIRDLPDAQREAWRHVFDHYVFNADSDHVEHIPEHSRGVLGTLSEDQARRLRTFLRNKLNR